jgi:hypothetical protein
MSQFQRSFAPKAHSDKCGTGGNHVLVKILGYVDLNNASLPPSPPMHNNPNTSNHNNPALNNQNPTVNNPNPVIGNPNHPLGDQDRNLLSRLGGARDYHLGITPILDTTLSQPFPSKILEENIPTPIETQLITSPLHSPNFMRLSPRVPAHQSSSLSSL